MTSFEQTRSTLWGDGERAVCAAVSQCQLLYEPCWSQGTIAAAPMGGVWALPAPLSPPPPSGGVLLPLQPRVSPTSIEPAANTAREFVFMTRKPFCRRAEGAANVALTHDSLKRLRAHLRSPRLGRRA